MRLSANSLSLRLSYIDLIDSIGNGIDLYVELLEMCSAQLSPAAILVMAVEGCSG